MCQIARKAYSFKAEKFINPFKTGQLTNPAVDIKTSIKRTAAKLKNKKMNKAPS